MNKFCCENCVKELPIKYTVIKKYEDCDCIITMADYYASQSVAGCNCGEFNVDCERCSNILYAQYREELDSISIFCEVCKKNESCCCYNGYYKIIETGGATIKDLTGGDAFYTRDLLNDRVGMMPFGLLFASSYKK